MKKMTTYFTDIQTASAAAYEIAAKLNSDTEIRIGTESCENCHVFDNCARFIFFGASIGTILTFLLSSISPGRFSIAFPPFSGFASGSVIGAITGCILDLLTYAHLPSCPTLTFSISRENPAEIIRLLRKRSGVTILTKP